MTLHIEAIDTIELGNRSYIAHDGRDAIVIDPQRDIDRVQARLADLGLRVGVVCETHIHNDYLTGGLALARETDAPYVVSAADAVTYRRVAVRDGDGVSVGTLSAQVLATPGHTPGHISFLIESAGGAPALFTGGSLLYGAVGRTDLVDPARTTELAAAQHRSVRRLADTLPADTAVFPTHGFGSFCAARTLASNLTSGTIADEQRRNPALLEADGATFVDQLVAGFTPYPTYYAHMSPRNLAGVDRPDLSPAPTVDAVELTRRISAGEWVIDLRSRGDYADGHIAGTVSFEVAPPFGTYLGWVVPFEAPLTLIASEPSQVAAAQRQLVRIGWDRPAGSAVGSLDSLAPTLPRRSYAVVSFSDLPVDLASGGGTVIDVRRDDERHAGYLPDAVHVPLHALLDPATSLPSGRLWVHCASGFRASIAASLLDRLGRDVVLIDDDMGHAADLGLLAS
jgi:glyoxylase-like metal-dependent hydrolase (beta-lactamase superfamily II)/rhodanese-related sulfurtransferase